MGRGRRPGGLKSGAGRRRTWPSNRQELQGRRRKGNWQSAEAESATGNRHLKTGAEPPCSFPRSRSVNEVRGSLLSGSLGSCKAFLRAVKKAHRKARPKAHLKARSKASLKAHFKALFKARSKLQSFSQSSVQSSRNSFFQSLVQSSRKSLIKSPVQSTFQSSFKSLFESNPQGGLQSVPPTEKLCYRPPPATTYRFLATRAQRADCPQNTQVLVSEFGFKVWVVETLRFVWGLVLGVCDFRVLAARPSSLEHLCTGAPSVTANCKLVTGHSRRSAATYLFFAKW